MKENAHSAKSGCLRRWRMMRSSTERIRRSHKDRRRRAEPSQVVSVRANIAKRQRGRVRVRRCGLRHGLLANGAMQTWFTAQ